MKTDAEWKKFYDKTALQRVKLREFAPVKIIGKTGFRELIQEVQKHLKNGMKILDVGCGTGHVLLEIYRTTDKKVKMIGIDYSSGMIKIAKFKTRGIKDISFFLMNAHRTKFADNYFDIIINRFGPRCYNEAYTILKKNGLFFLFVSDKGDWKEVRKHFGFKEYYGLKEQLKMLREVGFKIVKVQKFSSTEYYKDLEDFARVLEIIPFTPRFDRKKHSKLLKEYEKKYKTDWGIKSSHKKVLITSIKA